MKQDFQPVVITPEKAERLVRIVEGILSRHTGKKIVITSYSQDFSDLDQHQESVNS
ncbi:hypothetical protein LC048_17980 [Mesobacillus subterraneus]|uniref:hypothetical protein n=1 Tax=Mesobacillus subterraneus TaxID=285983 RepID=UPI001CFE2E27|nr:hypothetical protein [Mesobacillus subterraneus]WLR54316.1 hypothetical protein LC048_17980 [Mesobacillus subterraneus]